MLNKGEMLWSALAVLKFKPVDSRARQFGKRERRGKTEPGEPLDAAQRAGIERLLGGDFL